MASHHHRLHFSQLLFISSFLFFGLCVCFLASPVAAQCKNPPVIFNFGDSNSDTGGLFAGLGFPVDLPNGRTFFGRSTGRLSDGRLLIDFLCQSLNASLLSPYMDSLSESKFNNGANFAVVGSSTLPKYVPFSLNIQVMQFLHFKDVKQLARQDMLSVLQDLTVKRKKNELELVVAVCWAIWYSRNRLVFEGKDEDPKNSVARAIAMVESYRRIKVPNEQNSPGHSRISQLEWANPPKGCYKVNVDAAINVSNQKAGLGVVIRNSVGKVVAAAVQGTPYRGDVACMEAEAVLFGIQSAQQAAVFPIIIESDSKEVVDLSLKKKISKTEIEWKIAEIQANLENQNVSSLSYVPRSCSGNFINDEGFRNALYMIDIGQNDLADSFSKNLTYVEVIKRIPSVITEIKNAVKTLYDHGGRKFWIHNTGPLGCLPQKLSLIQLLQKKDLDTYGCISSYNAAARLFNEALLHFCQQMKSELEDATIVHVDIFSVKYDLIANSTKYGFSNPLMACCGFGGPPYNYNIQATCGHRGCPVCADGSKSISWDGIHYTEAANAIIASKVLSMAYSTPRTPFDFFCRS